MSSFLIDEASFQIGWSGIEMRSGGPQWQGSNVALSTTCREMIG